MSNERFTQGEWVVNGMGSFPKSPNTICITVQLNEKREPLDVDEYLANAHLIAAAPDMYRALRDLVDNGKIFFDDDYADARAALAKADGVV